MTRLVFIGGMGRSGSNLLRQMLDCHPLVAAGPEFDPLIGLLDQYREVRTKVLNGRISVYMCLQDARAAFRRLISEFLSPYGMARGKEIVVEKTPSNVWYFNDLAELFPEAQFIHIVRDGRDVACSHLEVGQRFAERGLLNSRTDLALTSICHAAITWAKTIEAGMAFCSAGSPLHLQKRAITVRYCDLVVDPEREARRICEFLGIAFERMMLEPEKMPHDQVIDGLWVPQSQVNIPIVATRIGRWRRDMPRLRDRLLFAGAAQRFLNVLGYEQDMAWVGADFDGTEEDRRREVALAHEEISRNRKILEEEETKG